MIQLIDIVWNEAVVAGEIAVDDGRIDDLNIVEGQGTLSRTNSAWRLESDAAGLTRVRLQVEPSPVRYGRGATLVTVAFQRATNTGPTAITFNVADVNDDFPIFVEAYGVAVVPAETMFRFDRFDASNGHPVGYTALSAVELGPEPSWEEAFRRTQNVPCETILGLSRDHRTWNISTYMDTITISHNISRRAYVLEIPIGRGRGARYDLKRRLKDGVLPILKGRLVDGDIVYEATMFPTLLSKPLVEENVKGTPFLVAEHGHGMPHPPAIEQLRQVAEADMQANPPEDIMLCYELKATNTAKVPRPVFFYTPNFDPMRQGPHLDVNAASQLVADGHVYGEVRFNGGAWPSRQIAWNVLPGETVVAEYRLFHGPQPKDDPADMSVDVLSNRVVWERAFRELLDEARHYWKDKLDRAAQVSLPDRRLNDMIRTGFLHLDLITYGKQNDTLAPMIGVYSPIGSESAPIIQFYDSYGRPDLARRCLQYFLDKQHPDGFIQNFGGYMLETGAALWSFGEHYRYTRDDAWVESIADKIRLSADWIMKRRRDDTVDPDLPGAGLIAGKVADPEDAYRIFMLNGYHYIGLRRVAEMLAQVDPERASRYAEESAAYREDIRKAFRHAMSRSPVIPLGDGRWVPSAPPWVEGRGYGAMVDAGDTSYTHSAVFARDSLLGPLYLVFTEILDIDEVETNFLLEGHYEWMTHEGVAFSQPYYSRHPSLHLRRGERKAFLRALYNGVAGLADRETYTFWEHHYGVSPHKTHEEGWFLMQTRWMLYREEGDVLHLLPGCSRREFADGCAIRIDDMRSYFGPIQLEVRSRLSDGTITVHVHCPEGKARGLGSVRVHVFHPDGQRAVSVVGATYDADAEAIIVPDVSSPVEVVLHYR